MTLTKRIYLTVTSTLCFPIVPNFVDIPSTTMSLDSISISEEVCDALSSLDPHKATGIDGISPT